MIMTYIELSVWFSLLLNSVCSFERRQLSPLFAQILDFIRGHILNWLKSMISVKSFRLLIEFNCIICHQMETDLRCIGIHCSSCLMEFLKQFVSIEKKKKTQKRWVNLVRCEFGAMWQELVHAHFHNCSKLQVEQKLTHWMHPFPNPFSSGQIAPLFRRKMQWKNH